MAVGEHSGWKITFMDMLQNRFLMQFTMNW